MGQEGNRPAPPYAAAGKRLRRLREAKGLSRSDLAKRLNADVTSLSGWESGKRKPRDRTRSLLAHALGTDIESYYMPDDEHGTPIAASLVDTLEDLPDLLMELTERAQQTLRALRLAAPYATTAYVQTKWRNLVNQRLLDGTLEVQRIEIFYNLRRLQEILSNVFRYDGCRYFVKCHCPGIADVVPGVGGYFFDDDEFLLGAYWMSLPPHHRPGLRVSGAPFRIFFQEYWNEIWRRGTALNISGAGDLSAIQSLAFALGLPQAEWDRFVEGAKTLEMADGAPPLV